MRTNDDDIMIEPIDGSRMTEEEREGFESDPHVIYKKRHSSNHVHASQGGSREEKLQYCGKGRRRKYDVIIKTFFFRRTFGERLVWWLLKYLLIICFKLRTNARRFQKSF